MTADAPREPPRDVPGVARDPSSMTGILEVLAAEGFPGELMPRPGGSIQCGTCGERSDAARFRFEALRRMEGASDPDEMVAIAALRCPLCAAGGTLVLTYGPEVTDVDAAVLQRLPSPPPPLVDAGGARASTSRRPNHGNA